MGKYEKLLDRVLRGRSDTDISFDDIKITKGPPIFPVLQALHARMKNDWNCESGKKPKKDALRQVAALLRQSA